MLLKVKAVNINTWDYISRHILLGPKLILLYTRDISQSEVTFYF